LDEENRTNITPVELEEENGFWLCTITHVASQPVAAKRRSS
jgi:hypothetical protein